MGDPLGLLKIALSALPGWPDVPKADRMIIAGAGRSATAAGICRAQEQDERVRSISLPSVPPDATAVRPDWADLPADLRAAIATRLGAPVTRATTAGGGFTRGFAATLELADGARAFVKAASLDEQRHLVEWYAHEAVVTAVLPSQVPAPRPRWTSAVAGHFVLCFDAVEGRMPSLPWIPAELDAALAAWAEAAAALRKPPTELVALGLPRLSDIARADLSWWREIAEGRQAMPPEAPPCAPERLQELVALEAALPGYVDSTHVMHCDLRLDNVLIDRAGRVWFCDWNWVCHGPAWFDTASLLITSYASGLDADARFAAHPTARNAPADGLDAGLAALAGYLLGRAAAPPTGASPHLRAHQRWSGEMALAWLASRRGW